jgi:hypothetical protein
VEVWPVDGVSYRPAADNLRSVALMDAALRSSVSEAFVPVDLGS